MLDEVLVPAGSRLIQVVYEGSTRLDATPPGLVGTPPGRSCIKEWEAAGFPEIGYLYIGRAHRTAGGRSFAGSRWANPFRVREFGRQECLRKFADYLFTLDFILEALFSLAGTKLVCHCMPSERCHADIIIEALR